jgi:predicted nucleic acid-binding protein
MSGELPFDVVDSSVLISLLLNEDCGEERASRAEDLLDTNNTNRILLLPTIARLEIAANADVRHAQHQTEVDVRRSGVRDALRAIDELGLLPADLTARVVSVAEKLIPCCNIKAADAAIVATAVAYHAKHVYTWDDKLIRAAGMDAKRFDVRLSKPPRVTAPKFDLSRGE